MVHRNAKSNVHIVHVLLLCIAAGCQGEVNQSTNPVDLPEDRPEQEILTEIRVTPRSATLFPGDEQQFTAEGFNQIGQPLDIEESWSATTGTISDDGLFTAGDAIGAGTVTASDGGVSGEAAVSVLAEPWLRVGFDGYVDSDDLLADCGTFACGEDDPSGGSSANSAIELDDAVAPPGRGRSMRYDYNHGGDGCNTLFVGRQIRLPENVPEVWVEAALRWSPNFRTTNGACPPNDHKLLFCNTEQDNTLRWELKVGSDVGPEHSVVMRAAGTNAGENDERRVDGLTAAELWDGEWHQVRLQFRHSQPSSASNGLMRLWIDGVLHYEETGISNQTSNGDQDRIRAVTLGSNKDDGPAGEPMSLWWGYVYIWREAPGF